MNTIMIKKIRRGYIKKEIIEIFATYAMIKLLINTMDFFF